MNYEILDIKTSKKLAKLEKENKKLNDEVVKLRDLLYKKNGGNNNVSNKKI